MYFKNECVRFSVYLCELRNIQMMKVTSEILFNLTGNVQLALWLHPDEWLHVVSFK